MKLLNLISQSSSNQLYSADQDMSGRTSGGVLRTCRTNIYFFPRKLILSVAYTPQSIIFIRIMKFIVFFYILKDLHTPLYKCFKLDLFQTGEDTCFKKLVPDPQPPETQQKTDQICRY